MNKGHLSPDMAASGVLVIDPLTGLHRYPRPGEASLLQVQALQHPTNSGTQGRSLQRPPLHGVSDPLYTYTLSLTLGIHIHTHVHRSLTPACSRRWTRRTRPLLLDSPGAKRTTRLTRHRRVRVAYKPRPSTRATARNPTWPPINLPYHLQARYNMLTRFPSIPMRRSHHP